MPDKNKLIESKVEGDDYGSWSTEGELNVYTPKMSFFTDVTPHELSEYFLTRDPDDNVRLNLP
jgi:hypothetical protein